MKSGKEYRLAFHGPFRFLNDKETSVFKHPHSREQGIYVWAVPFGEQYLPYYIGETGDSFSGRLKSHVKEYLSGGYRVYETDPFRRGEKTLVWKGTWLKGTEEGMPDFLDGYLDYTQKILSLLGTFEIFLAPLKTEESVRKRIEGAIARCLFDYQKKNNREAFIEKEDRNRLRRRLPTEHPISLTILGGEAIIGLRNELSF